MIPSYGGLNTQYSLLNTNYSSKTVFPHHTFDGMVGSLVVFRIGFVVVIIENIPFYGKINELADGHAGINPNRVDTRDFQGPVVAKTYIALAGGSVDIDTQPSHAGFSFQERDSIMCFGVFFRNP